MSVKPALFTAIREGRVDDVRALLAAGADPIAQMAPGLGAPLHGAADCGQVEIVATLLSAGVDPNHLDPWERPALCNAARNGSAEAIAIMRLLMEAGAQVDQGAPCTALLSASGDSVRAMELLLDWGADPNHVAPGFGTALHECVKDDSLQGVRLLLSRGADPSIPSPPRADSPSLTPLELARKLKHRAIVALLEGKPPPSLDRKWFFQWLDALKDDPVYELQPPASEAEIAAFVAETSAEEIELPPLLLDIYRRTAGQPWGGGEPLTPDWDGYLGRGCSWCFLDLDGTRRNWRELTKWLEHSDQRNLKPDPGVAAAWWHRKWIPILADTAGGYVCLDFAPTSRGAPGQVILFEHDSPHRPLLADSLDAFLATFDFGQF